MTTTVVQTRQQQQQQHQQQQQQPGGTPGLLANHSSVPKHPNNDRASLLLFALLATAVFLILRRRLLVVLLNGKNSSPLLLDAEPQESVAVVVLAVVAALLLLFVHSHGGIKRRGGAGKYHEQLPFSTASSSAAPAAPGSPPTLSPQSSRCLSLASSSESTVSEDSILAAISTLFIEVEQQVEQEEYQAQQQQHQRQQEQDTLDGCLTVRLLPRGYVDYENRLRDSEVSLFPEQEQFAKMASALRESIEPMLVDVTQGPLTRAYKTVSIIQPCDDWNDVRTVLDDDNDETMTMVALLDLRLTIPSQCNPKIHHCVHMHLHRPATELAVRTLERVEISLSRKLRQEEHILAAKLNDGHNVTMTTTSANTIDSSAGRQKSHRAIERERRRRDYKEHQQREQQQQQTHPRFLVTSSSHATDKIDASISSPPPPPPSSSPLTPMERQIDCEYLHHHHGQTPSCIGSVDSSICSRGSCCRTARSNYSKAWSTIWVKDERQESNHGNDGFRLFPLEQQESVTLWKELARHQDKRIHLQLRSASRRAGRNKGDIFHSDDDEQENSLPPVMKLSIHSCPPTILEVDTYERFTAFVYVGVPLVIETTVLHATRAMIIWFIVEDNRDGDGDDSNDVDMHSINYTPICFDSATYTPRLQDIGKRVGVLIIPMRPAHLGKGQEESFCFQQKVQARPELPLLHPLRSEWMEPRIMVHKMDSNDATNDSITKPLPIRVMTYNLLADLYTSRDHDQHAFYAHCPVRYLNRKRRLPLLLYEMISLQPDIICLQEVDASVYDHLLRPCLESCAANYQGYYCNKASVQLEGCAMFWSLGRFHYNSKPGQNSSFALRDLFTEVKHQNDNDGDDDWSSSMQRIYRLLDENPLLATVTKEKIGQVLQLAELRLLADEETQHPQQDKRSVVVGNTHLFYHPLADHVRVIQAYMVCRQLDAAHRRACGGAGCPMILCGDFNSYPLSGTIQLLLQGSVGPEHRETWKHLNDYHWAMGQHDFLLEHGFIGNGIDETPAYEDEAFEDALEDEIISQVEDSISDEDDGEDDGDYYLVDPLDVSFSLNEDCIKVSRDVLGETTTQHRRINRRRKSSGRAPTIALPDSFPRFVSGYKDMPEFTNYAIDFAETLDYILVSSITNNESADGQPALVPRKSAPIPTTRWMKQNDAAMPNAYMPSDHVSLVCDLDWVANTSSKAP